MVSNFSKRVGSVKLQLLLCSSDSTGVAEFEYRGSRYDDGFMLANTEMIKAAIDSYIEANLK